MLNKFLVTTALSVLSIASVSCSNKANSPTQEENKNDYSEAAIIKPVKYDATFDLRGHAYCTSTTKYFILTNTGEFSSDHNPLPNSLNLPLNEVCWVVVYSVVINNTYFTEGFEFRLKDGAIQELDLSSGHIPYRKNAAITKVIKSKDSDMWVVASLNYNKKVVFSINHAFLYENPDEEKIIPKTDVYEYRANNVFNYKITVPYGTDISKPYDRSQAKYTFTLGSDIIGSSFVYDRFVPNQRGRGFLHARDTYESNKELDVSHSYGFVIVDTIEGSKKIETLTTRDLSNLPITAWKKLIK